MFRAPQILTLPCPIRPLLLGVRDPHLTLLTEHTGCTSHIARANRDGATADRADKKENFSIPNKTASSLSPRISSVSDCRKQQLSSTLPKAPLPSCPRLTQNSVSSKPRLEFHPWMSTILEHFAENPRSTNNYHGCIKNKCPQLHRRPYKGIPYSFSIATKLHCSLIQSTLFCSGHFLRPFSSLKHRPWVFSASQRRLPQCAVSAPKTRAVHWATHCEALALRDCFSPENEERCRQTLGPNLKLYERMGEGRSQGKCASVLVSLCFVEGEPAFLFTLRSSTLKGRHKGDVSFAGGKSDPSDKDIVDTALREAKEELGVNVATEKVWGVLKPLRDKSGMMIAPVLANLGPIEQLSFKPNPGEVEEIFTLSISHLCNPLNRGYTHFRTGVKYGYTLPVFRNGKHRVWGLTAVALEHTLKLIVPP
ncbi:nucleoside diphosphate-linked moiety X motif 8 isoform X2 [Lampris incognitus]|nr:nucleoside diphosphate-linked moiety X motif 8 isoform X2 [Lampris incognitus]XP_056139589.1 nucleoside diphosphate-linked moiety X motif 8 isoform X2 [Lampris incognitus]XP_056139590.1 nucleoside diphosphate-linked moiety X motif 8 isoform X2 [Lampris incognitus]